MKVLLVNGSPHKEGCTYTALQEVEKELTAAGIETEMFWLGTKPISGCLGCGQCIKRGPNGEKPSGLCFMDDIVNEFLAKADREGWTEEQLAEFVSDPVFELRPERLSVEDFIALTLKLA